MEKKQSVQFLSKVSLFDGMNERSLKMLADRLIEREYKAGDHILEQGKEGFGLFIIASGKADVQYVSEDGSTSRVNSLETGEFFGEMALLDDGPRSASVIASEDTTCLILNRIDFVAIMLKDAEMGVLIATVLAKRLRKSLEQK
jgi:CRP-like cAMP-binding protein